MGMIKIDDVSTADEASAVEAAGADVIMVRVETILSRKAIPEIRKTLRRSQLCLSFDWGNMFWEDAIEEACNLGADCLEFAGAPAPPDWREDLDKTGLPVFYSGIGVSYESEQASEELAIERGFEGGATYVQLQLLSDLYDPWSFLTEEAHKEPGELLQMREIVNLTEKYPLILGMNVTAPEAPAFRMAFPAAVGVSFSLVFGGIIPILDILAALRKTS